MNVRLATIDIGGKVGDSCAVPLSVGPHLKQHELG